LQVRRNRRDAPGSSAPQEFSTTNLGFPFDIACHFPYTYGFVRGYFCPVGEREGLRAPEQSRTERGKMSGRNGTPVPQSRVTLSASTRTHLLTGSSAGIIVGCSGIAAVPFLCVNSTTRRIAEFRDVECEVIFSSFEGEPCRRLHNWFDPGAIRSGLKRSHLRCRDVLKSAESASVSTRRHRRSPIPRCEKLLAPA